MTNEPQKNQIPDPESVQSESKFISYQTNKVPWQIHVMFAVFTLCGIIYLVRLAIPDFIRWW